MAESSSINPFRGEDGLNFHSGVGVPSSDFGKNLELYLDLQTLLLYKKSLGSWTLKCSIKGVVNDEELQQILDIINSKAGVKEVNQALEFFVRKADVYTKEESNELLLHKADESFAKAQSGIQSEPTKTTVVLNGVKCPLKLGV